MQVVPAPRVREEFDRRYVTTGEDPTPAKKAQALAKAFKRALDKASTDWNLNGGSWAGTDWLWRPEHEPGHA